MFEPIGSARRQIPPDPSVADRKFVDKGRYGPTVDDACRARRCGPGRAPEYNGRFLGSAAVGQ